MPVPDALARTPAVAGPLGSLALSQIRPAAPTLALRALRWHDGLTRLGLALPFFLVHDVGMMFAAPAEQYEITTRVDLARVGLAEQANVIKGYRAILSEIDDCEAARKAGQLRLSDDLIITVLARLLGAVSAQLTKRPPYASDVPVDASLFERIESQLDALYRATDRTFELATLTALQSARLFVVTLADALDTDTLHLFGMLGSEGGGAGAMSLVDLMAAFTSPEANDIVNFSLEILPSVLETKTRPAAGTTAAFGYSGIGTRGSIDSLVLSELAWDDFELARRLIDNEVLYYAREQSRDEQRRIHILLIDASASMRGDRQTFARGMALATGKKLVLEGEEVAFRFFDSRLYELTRAKNGQIPTAYLLSFKGERGRNPARVFAELATELEILRHRDTRSPVVHLFTHAALYVPRPLVEAVRNLAHIAGVFILPSGGKLDLEYLDLLNAHWVVDHATLETNDARSDAAKSILGESSSVQQKIRDEEEDGPRSTGAPSRRGGPRSEAAPTSMRPSRPPPDPGGPR
ncbi:MAG: hypothetical protein U0414_33565 [Polyangiaceae bacterium]